MGFRNFFHPFHLLTFIVSERGDGTFLLVRDMFANIVLKLSTTASGYVNVLMVYVSGMRLLLSKRGKSNKRKSFIILAILRRKYSKYKEVNKKFV